MKKLAIIPVLALTVALVAAPVSAATSSPDTDDGIVSVTVDGKDMTNDFIYTRPQTVDASTPQEVKDNLDSAIADIQAVNEDIYKLQDNSGTIETELQAAIDFYGSTEKPADLINFKVFDVSYAPNGQVQDISGDIEITLDDYIFTSDWGYIIIVHDENGVWKVIDPSTYTISATGAITFSVPNCSPFIVVYGDRDKIVTTTPTPTATAAPTATTTPAAKAETKSPQTGESAGIYLLLISAGLAVAGIVCVKRAMKPSEK